MKTLLTVLFVLGASHTAAAQTHPCDAPVPATGTISSVTPAYVEFCQPTNNNIDAVTVYRNGTPTNLTGLIPGSTASAAGLTLYRVLLGTVPVGTYKFEVSAWNKTLDGVAQEGPRSAPFTLTVAAPVLAPTAPLYPRVTP